MAVCPRPSSAVEHSVAVAPEATIELKSQYVFSVTWQ
jgi:hypothetical protein